MRAPRDLPFGVSRTRNGAYLARLRVYGVQENLGLHPTPEAASEVVQQVIARWPDRLHQPRGHIEERHGHYRAILRGKKLGTHPTRDLAEQAIAAAVQQ